MAWVLVRNFELGASRLLPTHLPLKTPFGHASNHLRVMIVPTHSLLSSCLTRNQYICPVFPFLTCKQPLARNHLSSCIYPVFPFLTCKQPLVHNHCLAHICPAFPFLTCKQPLAHNLCLAHICPLFPFLTCKQQLARKYCSTQICPLVSFFF